MAVTIDTKKAKQKAERARKTSGPPPETGGSFDDYALPQVRQNGLKALGIWVGVMAVLCLPWWLREEVHPFAYGMNLWWFCSTVAYLFGAPLMVLRRLRVEGPAAEINEQTQPRLKALLKKGSALLGIGEPDSYLENEGSARIYPLPAAVIFRKAAFDLLTPDEMNCLAVRCLVHIRQRHARRLALMQFFEATNPPIVKFLVWPVWIYYALLKALWYHSAQQECDRISLLLIKNTRLLMSAVLKEQAANDETMKELKVTSADVTNWINQAGHIGMAGEEISTQYKLGRAIHEDPVFEERLLAMQKWGESAEFKTAVQKLAEAQKRG